MNVRNAVAVGGLASGIAVLAVAVAAAAGPSPGVMLGGSGVLAPGGAVRYVAYSDGTSASSVAAVSTKNGATLKWRSLGGAFGIPLVAFDGSTGGLTPDARTLVLGSMPGTPSSRLAVLDTRKLSLRTVIELPGQFSFDAISPDGNTIYLIQYVNSANTIRYRVRAYDVAAGQLVKKVVADARESEDSMEGSPVTRAVRGSWVYTLYGRPAAPFIHALDVVHRRAVCIDLPWQGSQDGIWKMRMSVSRDGRSLFVQAPGGQAKYVVDTRTFKARSA